MKDITFSQLLGKTIASIDGADESSERVVFTLSTGEKCIMRHHQDCCESVSIVTVIGDPASILNSKVIAAEELSDEPDNHAGRKYYDSHTWTVFRIRTLQGSLEIQWLGESNGYYSEGVSFGLEASC